MTDKARQAILDAVAPEAQDVPGLDLGGIIGIGEHVLRYPLFILDQFAGEGGRFARVFFYFSGVDRLDLAHRLPEQVTSILIMYIGFGHWDDSRDNALIYSIHADEPSR